MAVPARIGIVTLGVADLDRSIAFYQALGWERCASSIDGEISWFRTADSYLGLFPYEALAEDARISSPARGTFDGITLAMTVERVEDVETVLADAVAVGATLLKPATELPFAVSGYFADPDGYPWEVAYNPSFPIGPDGRITIP
jgi:catechol 2,3-dioxygenase-like lactoylglutathione lyase family enzyme